MPTEPDIEPARVSLTDRRVVLLGPQRRPTVDQVAGELVPEGHFATVTAGWQEREPDDAELDALLGGRSANLHLYGRWLDIQERDPEFATAELAHRDLLDELRTLHLVQLENALTGLHTLAQRNGDRPEAIDAVLSDAKAALRLVDRRHAERVQHAHDEFEAEIHLGEREAIVTHRAQVSDVLTAAPALFLAGGHVGVLLRLLSLFQVGDHLPDTVVAWSAGAMSLTERVVLFHDRTPQGPSPVEIFDRGLGVLRSTVVLPDARRRLLVDDSARMAELVQRVAPATCLMLDRGDRIDLEPGATELPASARTIAGDGTIITQEAA
jgi:hypothetical protein